MRIAYTELNDTLLKVYEGQGFPPGDYVDCAAALCWLAFRGWPILAQVASGGLTPTRPVVIMNEDAQTAVLDAHQNDGLLYGPLAVELLYHKAKANTSQTASITLQNATYPALLIPRLSQLASRGVNVRLKWQEPGFEMTAVQSPHAIHPTLIKQPLRDRTPDATAFLLCGTAVPDRVKQSEGTQRIAADELAQIYATHIQDGLPIAPTLWQRLVMQSKAVLVEATDTSRTKGAGENA